MIERIIDRNILFLQKHISCNEEQAAIYKYALQILYTYLIDITVLFSISYCFGRLYQTVIMTFIFAALQVFGGGYHADTKLRCFLTMMAGCAVGHMLINLLLGNILAIIFLAFVVSSVIFSLVPITNKRHPVAKKVYKRSKVTSRIIIILILISILIGSVFEKQIETTVITVTLILYMISLLIIIIKNIKKF